MPKNYSSACRCGADEDRLEKLSEQVIENTGSKPDAPVKDHTCRLYLCRDCDFMFWQYGFFWEKY